MTTLKLGYSDPRTDAFGAHPVLGPVLDLNDGQTFVLLAPDGLALPPPPRTLVPIGNIRTQGERGVRAVYRHSREVTARLVLGPAANYASLAATIRTLRSWVNAAPALPVTLQYQPFGASAPVYLDVIGCAADLPESESDWLRLQLEPIELVFVCRPGLRGDRITLANAVSNPGYEQGSGPGVSVFTDPLSSLNAYSAAAALTYRQAVLNDRPLRLYRLNETTGTVATDTMGTGNAGTYAGGFTQGSTALVSGDTDTSTAFNGTTGNVTANMTGLPTGNGTWSLEALVQVTAFPASAGLILEMGANVANQAVGIMVDATGHLGATVYSVANTLNAAAITTGTTHHLCATYDGTTIRVYQDGTPVATSAPAAINVTAGGVQIGEHSGGAFFLSGKVQAAAVYNAVLTATQVQQHAQLALGTFAITALALAANVLTIASATRTSFGSPAWGAIQSWQVRYQYAAGLQATVVLHYTDSQNYLVCVVSGTSMTLYYVTAGLYHAMAFPNAYAALTPGSFYWLQATQFPTPPAGSTGTSDPPAAQVILANDTAGAIGATIQNAGPAPTADSVTALTGKPALWSTGGTLALGGAFPGVQQVSLFGPGGWLCTPSAGTATGVSSGAWEGDQTRGASGSTANTSPNGPVTSYGAARIDFAPAGTVDALWHVYAGGAPATSSAIPIQTPGNVVYARVAVKSSGLGNGCTVALKYSEYDSTGTFLRSGTLQTLTIAGGVQLAWPAAGAWSLSGNWATGASCASVDLQVEVADTLAGNSANGIVWLDNAQAWDSTRLGVTTMGYHEPRFPQSPAQLVVTGLLGDLPAPALLQMGSYVSAWARGGHLSYGVGRLGAYRPAAILAAASHGFYSPAIVPQATPVLDPAGYGGYYVKAQVDTGGWQPRAFSPRVADALGVYHMLARYRTFDAAPASVLLRVQAEETLHPWYGDAGGLGSVATYYGPYATPLAAANQWTAVDAGQLALPPFPSGALSDPSQLYVVGRGQWVGSGAAAEGDASWMAWLPVDGSLLLGTLNFPSNSGVATMTSAVWVYADGLLVNQGSASSGPATSYSLETAAIPNPAHAAGGVGTLTTAAVNVNNGADPYLTLDPTLGPWNGAGVNQAVGVVYDEQATVLPLAVEVLYSPLYLEPR